MRLPRSANADPVSNLLAILAGALLLSWPLALNTYPFVYSDTGGFLEQALMPDIGWDKPWIYGPFLTPFHARITLIPAAFAQSLILSAMLWMTMTALGNPRKTHHLAICALLTLASAAPWFTNLLMPDIFAPITVLGLFVLAAGRGRIGPWGMAWVAVITTIAIASHLAHLILAATCIATLCILAWELLWRPAIPLLAALLLLVVSNIVGNGVVAISPFGADFALARLIADGPARDLIQRECPQAGYRLCAWKDHLPTDSDDFLWNPNGPVWAEGYGPVRIAPEARRIVIATILAEPLPVLRAALHNTARQLLRTDIGDALIPDHLGITIDPRLAAYFPPEEVARFNNSLEAQGLIPGIASKFNPLYRGMLVLGAIGTLWVSLSHWRNNRRLAIFAALIAVAILANAGATGALSGPHDRYQARIAWLLLLPPAVAISLSPRGRRMTRP